MNSIFDTLSQTYQMLQAVKKPYPPEISTILSALVSPERIREFPSADLYLDLMQLLLQNRENVSLPDTASLYDKYMTDCLKLHKQMDQAGGAREEWLDCCLRLLENLKTPYYPVYAAILFHLKACFPEADLFRETLRASYSVIIRSSEDTNRLIKMTAEHIRLCSDRGWLSGKLLSDLFIHKISLLADSGGLWKERLKAYPGLAHHKNSFSLLTAWLSLEVLYLEQGMSPVKENLSAGSRLAEQDYSAGSWLAERDLWIEKALCGPSDGSDWQAETKAAVAEEEHQVDSSFLNTYAYNMNTRTWLTNPAIGRDQEIRDLELILISPKKSPVLIGESGVGKTSVVEGLAWRLQKGQVPPLLRHKVIYRLTTTSLLSGTKYVGEMEDRIKQLTDELAKYPDIILFIDEIHTIVGAGSTESSHNDISNMLKPFIDRGEIKIIGATTSQEYEAYLLPDRALARRFYPIAIDEPDEALTMEILLGTIPAIEQQTRISWNAAEEKKRKILSELIGLSDKKNQPAGRITRLPELPLTLLEMAFSFAALDSREELSRKDLLTAVRHSNLLSREIKEQAEDLFQ